MGIDPNLLEELFMELNQKEITYVVLRKYDGLPHEVDGDIDIQIHKNQFEQAIAICEKYSFQKDHQTSKEIIGLTKRAITQPGEVLYWLKNKPADILEEIRNTSNPYSSGLHGYRSVKLIENQVMLDLKNHLAYESPMNNIRVRVHPQVEEKLYKRRQKNNCFYIPSPLDELAHIICHCIFDKDGEFSKYYQDRCNELFGSIQNSGTAHSQFKELLSQLFYDADDLVYKLVKQGEYTQLRERLYRYDEY